MIVWKPSSPLYPFKYRRTQMLCYVKLHQKTTGFIGVALLVNFNKHLNPVIPLREAHHQKVFLSDYQQEWLRDCQSGQAIETFDKFRVPRFLNTLFHLKPATPTVHFMHNVSNIKTSCFATGSSGTSLTPFHSMTTKKGVLVPDI